jgi:pimeloyl-ACP methyl ester carboxylesterase
VSDTLTRLARRVALGRRSPRIVSHVPEVITRPPLLFVHGAMHGAWCWEEHWIPAAVDRGWPCHAIDLGGNPEEDGSPDSDRVWTLRDCEKDLLAARETLPEPPVLIGHSTGALIVQRAMAEADACGAVLVAPVAPYGGYRFPLRVLRRHPTDAARLAALRPLPPRRDYLFSDRLDDTVAQRHLERMSPASIRAQVELGIPRKAEEIEDPVLVLGAEDDALIDPVDVVRTARIHGTQARMFRSMGHSMMLDAGWRAPLEVMLHWLAEEILEEDGTERVAPSTAPDDG